MKLLFIHDIKAKCFDGKTYARSYGKEVWDRYLAVFDSIKVCTRCYESDALDVKGVDLLTCDRVEFDKRIGMFKGPEVFFNRRVKEILREDIREADAVILRLDSFLGLMTARECRRIGKPYLIEVVGCAWDSFWNHGIDGKILAFPLFLMMKDAIKKSPYVVYVTKYFLQGRYPTKGKNINISNVSIPSHDDNILAERLKKIKRIGKDDIIHLFTAANVGVRYKGMHFVVEALALLKNQGYTNYVYHMIGEGDQTYIRTVAERCGVGNQIVFHGAVSHQGVMELLKTKADIYVQPSLQEGLPRSVIEAMSLGVPCLASDVAGIPELLDEQFMFDRKKNIPQQLVNMIKAVDAATMLQQAMENFDKAKDYETPVLNKRRTDFLNQFKQYIESGRP